MVRTITYLYDTYDEAVRTVRMLEDAGIRSSDISIVAREPSEAPPAGRPPVEAYDTAYAREPTAVEGDEGTAAGAGAGASVGTVLGGGAGLLAGIGALAIPGVGPVVAAGWLIATLTGAGVGAAAGGLLGSLVGAGHSHHDAHIYAEGVRRGGAVLSVRADDTEVPRLESLLENSGRVDLSARGSEYRAGGWQGVDETTPIAPAAPVTPAVPLDPSGVGNTVDDGRVVGDTASGLPLLNPVEVERQRLGISTHA